MLCEFCSYKITIESQWYSTIGIYCQTPRSVGLLGWVSFRLQVYVCRSTSRGQMGNSYLGLVLWTGAPRETNGSTEALIWCHATSTLHWQGKTVQLVAKPGVGNKYCPLRQKGGIFRISRIVRTGVNHSIYQWEVGVSKNRRTFIYFIFKIFYHYYYYLFLLYNIVLVLPYINMHLPWVYTCSLSWTPIPPPSHCQSRFNAGYREVEGHLIGVVYVIYFLEFLGCASWFT